MSIKQDNFYREKAYQTTAKELVLLIGSKDMVAMIDFDDVLGDTSAAYSDFINSGEYREIPGLENENLTWDNDAANNVFFYEDIITRNGVPLNQMDDGYEFQNRIMLPFLFKHTESIPAIKGAADAVKEMQAEGFKIVCITQLEEKNGAARVRCIQNMGLSIPVIIVDSSKREDYEVISSATEGLCIVIDDMKKNTVEAAVAANGTKIEGARNNERKERNKAGVPLCSMVFQDHARKKGMPEITTGSNFTAVENWDDVRQTKTYYVDRVETLYMVADSLGTTVEEAFKLYEKAKRLTGASYSEFIKAEGYSTTLKKEARYRILARTADKFVQRIKRINSPEFYNENKQSFNR